MPSLAWRSNISHTVSVQLADESVRLINGKKPWIQIVFFVNSRKQEVHHSYIFKGGFREREFCRKVLAETDKVDSPADLRNTMFGMHLRTKNPWWFDYSMLLDCIRSGYEVASRLLHIQLGRLEAGCEADFALAPYLPPTPITQENVWAHILDGIFNSYRPSDVWCAGEAKMRNYQVQFDESEICQKSRASAQKVWARISQQK